MARGGVGAAAADAFGSVDVTTTNVYEYMEDQWTYEYDVYNSEGVHMGTSIQVDYHVNYSSQTLIKSSLSFSNVKGFWE